MTQSSAADLCEQGQELLMRMEYLKSEAVLAQAEREALAARDWDLLARLYMPRQEARRQRRQRCGDAIVPMADSSLPQPRDMSIDELRSQLPAYCILLSERDLPPGSRKGTFETYGQVMALWERLHTPFLAVADAQPDPLQRIEGYRKTI